MKLSTIFQQLMYGELSQISLGESDGDGNLVNDYAPLIAHINLGLTELHKRFNLKVKTVKIQEFPNISTYYIDSAFSISTDDVLVSDKYVIDSIEQPYKDDLLVITKVKDGEDNILFVNDENEESSLELTQLNAFTSPSPDLERLLTITYRAGHVDIPADIQDPSVVNVDLPASHLEALLLYVAYRVNLPMGLVDGMNIGTTYFSRFEGACMKLEELAITNKSNNTNKKLECNGWV